METIASAIFIVLAGLTLLLSGCDAAQPPATPTPIPAPTATATPDPQAAVRAYAAKYDAWSQNYLSGLNELGNLAKDYKPGYSFDLQTGWADRYKDTMSIFTMTDKAVLSYGKPPAGWEAIHNDLVAEAGIYEDMVKQAQPALDRGDIPSILQTFLNAISKAEPYTKDAVTKSAVMKAKANLEK